MLSGLGDVRVSTRRRARARRAGPRPWLPRAPLLSPSSGSGADPSPPSPGAQPSPAQPGSVSGRSRPWLKIGGHLTIR